MMKSQGGSADGSREEYNPEVTVACAEVTLPKDLRYFLLLHNLALLGGYNLGLPSITRDLSRHTNLRILIFRFRRAELGAIAAPDQDRENFLRVWLVEIQECWLTFTFRGEVRAHHLPADGSDFSDVILCLACADLIGLRCGAERNQQQNKRSDEGAGRFHGSAVLDGPSACANPSGFGVEYSWYTL
jgi:hypothetical protein